jgi:hypothetical protein
VAIPRRKVGGGPPRKELLVLVEGAVTEEAYLLLWKRRLRRQALIEIPDFHGTPLSLVEKAIELKRFEAKEERRGRGSAHDEYWCVFDVDTHPHLREAVELAASEEINLAISNPCIELWFLLHFAEQTGFIECRAARRAVRDELGDGKGLSPDALEALWERYEQARGRAERLDEKHRGDGTPAPGNPSSGVWRLIESMREPPQR